MDLGDSVWLDCGQVGFTLYIKPSNELFSMEYGDLVDFETDTGTNSATFSCAPTNRMLEQVLARLDTFCAQLFRVLLLTPAVCS